MDKRDELVQRLNRGLVITYCIFALALSTTLARLFTRARILRQFWIDDWLIAGAMLIGIVLVPFHYEISRALTLMIDASLADFHQLSPAVLRYGSRAARFNFIAGILYLIEFGSLKLSILAFYHRFLPRRPYLLVLYAIATCVVLFTVAACLVFLLQCRPISRAWDLTAVCDVNVPALQLSICVFHLVTDLTILLLPIPAVMILKAETRKKVALILLFSVGVLGTVITGLRLQKVVELARIDQPDLIRSFMLVADIVMWSQLEINLIIICANLPALAALWKRARQGLKSASELTGSIPYGSQASRSYALESQAGRRTTAPGVVKNHSSSQERIMPSDNDIVRSTTVVVDFQQKSYPPQESAV